MLANDKVNGKRLHGGHMFGFSRNDNGPVRGLEVTSTMH